MIYKNLFYFPFINKIGGVESFFWYIAQLYRDRDIVIVYKTGDENQIRRLRKYVRVLKFNGNRIRCERAFFNYATDIINYVDADEYFQIVHGDYKALRVIPVVPDKIDRILGVSQWVCKTYAELTGRKVELAYNPVMVPKPNKILHLISATRLTKEKGKGRMEKLASILDKAGVHYQWTIFTDSWDRIDNPNLVYREPRLDIIDFIADADYLIQLSDTEGFGFSIVESLLVGTPVILTKCPVFQELGIEDGVHGFLLDFDLSNVDIDAILKGVGEFTYTAPQERWGELLAKGESQYKVDMNTEVKVQVNRFYYDTYLEREVKKNEIITCPMSRAEIIEEAGFGVRVE